MCLFILIKFVMPIISGSKLNCSQERAKKEKVLNELNWLVTQLLV